MTALKTDSQIHLAKPKMGSSLDIAVCKGQTLVFDFNLSDISIERAEAIDDLVMAFDDGATIVLHSILSASTNGEFYFLTSDGALLDGKDIVESFKMNLQDFHTDSAAVQTLQAVGFQTDLPAAKILSIKDEEFNQNFHVLKNDLTSGYEDDAISLHKYETLKFDFEKADFFSNNDDRFQLFEIDRPASPPANLNLSINLDDMLDHVTPITYLSNKESKIDLPAANQGQEIQYTSTGPELNERNCQNDLQADLFNELLKINSL